MSEQLCLLWSKQQNALHIEPLSRTLEINIKRFNNDLAVNDYMPVAVGTREHVDSMAASFRKTLVARQLARR